MSDQGGVIGGLVAKPFRNLGIAVGFVLLVAACAMVGYMQAGWSFGDALYMVTLTIFTVGYGEVRPIDTDYLHVVTMATMVFGCTGVIIVTGSLVQALTQSQLEQFFGKRVERDIDRLDGHIIICGFGRIGLMLAGELASVGETFVIVERDEARCQEAKDLGYLCRHADATDEDVLRTLHVERAKVLATVLPDDAANVFITLSARSLNSKLEIIARGERPTTERKLMQAGADRVVMPAHIGAERIAEMILYPRLAHFLRGSEPKGDGTDEGLAKLGLDLRVITAPPNLGSRKATIRELERRGGGVLIVRIERADGTVIESPSPSEIIRTGDALAVVSKSGRLNLEGLAD
ncbi:MAG: potassium channel protein [Caulobacter sp.]|uniref:potassium channel family protein n=1 Tax=Caulobacter sp. CCH9-E1 TaxID=1768768 RepID=UPI00082970E2|nr:potassium channel protein [Caulobacter sp. CCH9-E1]MCK5909316.1 potassium channel protein [Caulobacter sp.]